MEVVFMTVISIRIQNTLDLMYPLISSSIILKIYFKQTQSEIAMLCKIPIV